MGALCIEQPHAGDPKFSKFLLYQFARQPRTRFEPAGIGEQVEDRQRDPAKRREIVITQIGPVSQFSQTGRRRVLPD